MKETKEFKVVEDLSNYLLDKLYEKGLGEALGEGEEDDYSKILYVKDNNENYPVDGYLKIVRLENKTIFETYDKNDEKVREEEFEAVISDDEIYNMLVTMKDMEKFYMRPLGSIYFKLDENIKDNNNELSEGTIVEVQIGDTANIGLSLIPNEDNKSMEELAKEGMFNEVLKSKISGFVFELQHMVVEDILKPFTEYNIYKVMDGYNEWYNKVYKVYIENKKNSMELAKELGADLDEHKHECGCGCHNHEHHHHETNPLVEKLKSTLQEGFSTLKGIDKAEAKELVYNFIDQLTK